MEMFSAITASMVVFVTLVANAFTKIMVMLLGVTIAFLAIPQSRAAAMFGVAVISAFAGGLLIQTYSVQQNWAEALSLSTAFGAGFIVYPFLTFFRKFNQLVSEDQEIVEMLFNALKKLIRKFLKIKVDKPENKK